MAIARFRNLSHDPRIEARFDEVSTALAEQRAALPQRLAAEGLSMMPAAAPTKAP